jgi:hypothetical protein
MKTIKRKKFVPPPSAYGASPIVGDIGQGTMPFANVGHGTSPIAQGGWWADGAWSYLGPAAVGAAAYHGYKRNRSAGWAIAWALCAGISPIITIAVALAEGFGKRKGSS